MVESPKESAPGSSKAATASTLVSARVWDVLSPAPVNTVKGALVPKALAPKRLRKISVEVHRFQAGKNKSGNEGSYEECIVRFLEPSTKELRKAAQEAHREALAQPHPHRSVEASSVRSSAVTTDDASVMDVPTEFRGARSDYFAEPDFDKGWNSKYTFPIKCIDIKGTSKAGVFLRIESGHLKHTRKLIFDSVEEAEDFCAVIRQELKMEKERGETKLRVAFSGKPMPKEEIIFLLEVVSGWNLPAGDFKSSDPFVEVTLGNKLIHKTDYISKTLDPIWTLKTGSLFLFKTSTKEMFLKNGLCFTVKDFDKFGKNEVLGVFQVEPQTIFDGKGERLEYKLEPPHGQKEVPGHVAIRCRRASEYDIKFMEEYELSKKKGALGHFKDRGDKDKDNEVKGGAMGLVSYFRRQTRIVKEGNKEIKQYKIRPGPDPKRVDETTWMNHEDLKAEVMKESQQWIDTGSGSLGRLFVEILGCEDLPNMDTGGRNKTDSFVSIVFEDTVIKTDIIDDCLNPLWPNWTQRAFIFHMFHSSSQLFLGVFDHDDGPDDHDLIGRVSVDLSNLRHDTSYVLKYNIYTTAKMSDRQCRGTITVRLRIEIADERRLLLSTLEPPPEMYVNVKKRKDFRVVHYTCTGKYDMTRYDMKYINAYIEELLALQHGVYYVQDAIMALMLWRGTFPISLFGKQFLLPVYSLSTFMSLVLVVERPQLFPALVFAAFGCFMVVVMDYRRSLPNPWNRCKMFSEFVWTLLYGKSYVHSETIKPFQNHVESEKYMEEWQKRIKESELAAARAYEENVKAQEEYEREMDEVGDPTTDISTKRGGISVDPFKPILYPVQQNLGMVCKYVRHAQHIISWEECYLSFWVTTGCFLLAFICIFIPWFFLIKWLARIIVWTAFGPWMKAVDIYYVQQQKPLSEEELMKKREADRQKRREATYALVAGARVKRENASKLKAMKKYLFGRFITRVPILKEDRFRDTPLPESTALPYKADLLPLSEVAMQEAGYNRKRIPGQHLVGDMIPQIEDVGFTEAPTGEATAHPRLVKSGPGGAIGSGPASDMQAYAKIGSVVVGAAVVSWIVVPVFSSLTEQALNWL